MDARIMLKIVLGLCTFWAAAIAAAQPWVEWIDRYPGALPVDNGVFEAKRDSEGNLIVLGDDIGPQGHMGTLIKYAPDGRRLWLRSWKPEGSGEQNHMSLAIGPDDSVISATSAAFPDRNYAAVVSKRDQHGNLLWAHRYQTDGHDWDVIHDLDVDEHGGVYVCGRSGGWAPPTRWLVYKLSPSGQMEWLRRPPPELNREPNEAYHVVVSPESQVVYAVGSVFNGRRDEYTTYGTDLIGCAYGYDGTQRPFFRLSPPASYDGQFGANEIANWNGNLLITGSVDLATPRTQQSAAATPIVLVTPNGIVLWVAIFDPLQGRRTSDAHGLTVSEESCLVSGGYGHYIASGEERAVVLRYNRLGERQSVFTYRNSTHRYFGFRHAYFDFAGTITALGGALHDILAVSFDRTGNVRWDYLYDGPGQNVDSLQGGFVDTRGGIYLAGTSVGVVSSADYVVMKLCQRWGDADNDGRVDGRDLEIVLERFGQTATPGRDGDVTEDGIVDDADLALVLWMFGTTCP